MRSSKNAYTAQKCWHKSWQILQYAILPQLPNKKGNLATSGYFPQHHLMHCYLYDLTDNARRLSEGTVYLKTPTTADANIPMTADTCTSCV